MDDLRKQADMPDGTTRRGPRGTADPRLLNNPKRIANLHAAITGERSYRWKGDEASYSAFHYYLSRHFPKSGVCEGCGAEAKTQYALIHGRGYSRNREDYRELCQRCHGRYDFGGERSAVAKLTAEEVAEIRRRYAPSRGGRGLKPNSTRALAAEFGVSHTTIRAIVAGRKWAAP